MIFYEVLDDLIRFLLSFYRFFNVINFLVKKSIKINKNEIK